MWCVPPSDFRVCRLCLVSINENENEMLAHGICSETAFPKKLFAGCKCFPCSNNATSSSGFGFFSDDQKLKNMNSESEQNYIHSCTKVPVLPALSNVMNSSIFEKNAVCSKNRSQVTDIPNRLNLFIKSDSVGEKVFTNNNLYNTSDGKADEADKQDISDDDSYPSIVIQILSCLSLNVSI